MIELRLQPHLLREGKKVIELYDGNKLLGTIYPSPDGSGVRIMSKYALSTKRIVESLDVIEVHIDHS